MKLTAWMVLLGLSIGALHCNSGETTEEATAVCEDLREDQACFDDAAMLACVSCREECGRECVQLESCPVQFGCN